MAQAFTLTDTEEIVLGTVCGAFGAWGGTAVVRTLLRLGRDDTTPAAHIVLVLAYEGALALYRSRNIAAADAAHAAYVHMCELALTIATGDEPAGGHVRRHVLTLAIDGATGRLAARSTVISLVPAPPCIN
jgi:hypothetical protein